MPFFLSPLTPFSFLAFVPSWLLLFIPFSLSKFMPVSLKSVSLYSILLLYLFPFFPFSFYAFLPLCLSVFMHFSPSTSLALYIPFFLRPVSLSLFTHSSLYTYSLYIFLPSYHSPFLSFSPLCQLYSPLSMASSTQSLTYSLGEAVTTPSLSPFSSSASRLRSLKKIIYIHYTYMKYISWELKDCNYEVYGWDKLYNVAQKVDTPILISLQLWKGIRNVINNLHVIMNCYLNNL